jgi:4-oxalomesaconate tautomerase
VVNYDGDTRIDGVPGESAAIPIDFLDIAGASCGALLPTGNVIDEVDGVALTCIDNGMPVVILRALDFDLQGDEAPAELEANDDLKARIEAIRLAIGPRMRLGDVARKTVPKMCLVSPARNGGLIATRTFIPHRVHEAIGVLGAVSVATACMVSGSVAHQVAGGPQANGPNRFDIEHPTGFFTVEIDVVARGADIEVRRSALVRTARKLMSGDIYIPAHIWGGA